MARPTKPNGIQKSPTQALVEAYAVVFVNGGWVARTYLVEADDPHDDSTPDTFSAAIGRVQRALARQMR